MIEKNRFYRQNNGPKARNLAADQFVSKDGYRVCIPAKCYTARGLLKTTVLEHVLGKWNQEKVRYLETHFGVQVLERAEEKKGA